MAHEGLGARRSDMVGRPAKSHFQRSKTSGAIRAVRTPLRARPSAAKAAATLPSDAASAAATPLQATPAAKPWARGSRTLKGVRSVRPIIAATTPPMMARAAVEKLTRTKLGTGPCGRRTWARRGPGPCARRVSAGAAGPDLRGRQISRRGPFSCSTRGPPSAPTIPELRKT